MTIFNKRTAAPPLISEYTAADYVNFWYSLTGLTEEDRAAASDKWESISGERWYIEAATAAHQLAYDTGRIDAQDLVVGADDDHAEIKDLAEAVAGGAAIDVAVAILVRDLLEDKQYRALTAWWSRFSSTWLPEHEATPSRRPAPSPDAPPPAAAEPMQPMPAPAHLDETVEIPRYRHSAAVPPGFTQAEYMPRAPMPGGPRPAPTQPVVPRQKVMSRAAQIALAKELRKRSAARHRTLANMQLVAGMFLAMFGAGDQLGSQILPPAHWVLRGFPDRLWACLIYVVLGSIVAWRATRRFAKATQILKGN